MRRVCAALHQPDSAIRGALGSVTGILTHQWRANQDIRLSPRFLPRLTTLCALDQPLIGVHPATTSVPGRYRTVLVVEDDTDIREATADVLREAGCRTVVEAVDGADALAKVDQLEGPCLIVLDLVMPRMDGLEFLARMRQHKRASQFSSVVMTARADPISVSGVVGVLRKPFDVEQLVALLDKQPEH